MAVRRTEVAQELIHQQGWEDRVRVEEVDLASMASVSRLVSRIDMLDGVVCNAGLQVPGELRRTDEGHELTFGVNHLAHFTLVMGLLSKLRRPGRVVMLGSGTHTPDDRMAKLFGFRGGRYTSAQQVAAGDVEPDARGGQPGRDRYATSKFCNLVFFNSLAKRFSADELGVFAVDPGLVPATGLAREQPALVRWVYRGLTPILTRLPGVSTPQRSGAAVAWAATAPELAGRTGEYFEFTRKSLPLWEKVRDPRIGADLWEFSELASGGWH